MNPPMNFLIEITGLLIDNGLITGEYNTDAAAFMAWLRKKGKGARSRCNNPNDDAYKYYGSRGIKWEFPSIDEFVLHMLRDVPLPPDFVKNWRKYSADRTDNDGNYVVGNMGWATKTQQCNNRRNSTGLSHRDRREKTLVPYRGQEVILSDLLARAGNNMCGGTFSTRTYCRGMSTEEAIEIPVASGPCGLWIALHAAREIRGMNRNVML